MRNVERRTRNAERRSGLTPRTQRTPRKETTKIRESRAVLGDLGVLERATASGREKRRGMRSSERGAGNVTDAEP